METPPPSQNFAAYPRPELEGTGPECPNCHSRNTKKVNYTWWGGVLGPRLFNLHKCAHCRSEFNGTTGAPATKGILIYSAVAILIMFVIIFAFRLAR
jgi:transposase-like protein